MKKILVKKNNNYTTINNEFIFNKNMSLWSKNKPSDNARTLISVSLKLERLNKNEIDVEIDKYLMD